MCAGKDTDAFRCWFRNSKVVNENGEPLVAYHGTAIDKASFRREGGAAGVGAYFTDSAEVASDYAETDGSIEGDPPHVIPVYLSLQNPYIADCSESCSISSQFRDGLEAQGYDGLIAKYDDGMEYVAFNPQQIKSAIGNSGAFDPLNADICDIGTAPEHVAGAEKIALNELDLEVSFEYGYQPAEALITKAEEVLPPAS